MRPTIITTVEGTDFGFLADQAIVEAMDDAVEQAAIDLAREMGQLAPVLTGALSGGLFNSPEKISDGYWELAIEDVPYVWRQEYEHRTKSGFIRRPYNRMLSDFPRRIEKAVDDVL